MSTLEVNTITPQSGTTLTLGGSGDTINLGSGASGLATTNGITEADVWRVTTNFTGDNDPIASNWERADGTGQGYFGTGMSQSSGVWTFPSTGFWFVRFTLSYYAGNAENRTDFSIKCSNDGSTFTNVALSQVQATGPSASLRYQSSSTETILDIINTSTHKVTFANNDQDNSNTKLGSTDFNYTFATFIKLGET